MKEDRLLFLSSSHFLFLFFFFLLFMCFLLLSLFLFFIILFFVCFFLLFLCLFFFFSVSYLSLFFFLLSFFHQFLILSVFFSFSLISLYSSLCFSFIHFLHPFILYLFFLHLLSFCLFLFSLFLVGGDVKGINENSGECFFCFANVLRKLELFIFLKEWGFFYLFSSPYVTTSPYKKTCILYIPEGAFFLSLFSSPSILKHLYHSYSTKSYFWPLLFLCCVTRT